MQAEYQVGNHLHCMQRKLVQGLVQLQQSCQRRRRLCCAQATQQVNRPLSVQRIVATLDIKQKQRLSLSCNELAEAAQGAGCLLSVWRSAAGLATPAQVGKEMPLNAALHCHVCGLHASRASAGRCDAAERSDLLADSRALLMQQGGAGHLMRTMAAHMRRRKAAS